MHTLHTHISGHVSHDVAIEGVAGELNIHDVERVGESAREAAPGRSRNPRCSVTASVLAPHVVKWGTAQLRSTSTAIAATLSGTRTGCVSVFLDSELFRVAAHAVTAVTKWCPEWLLPLSLPKRKGNNPAT